MLNVHSATARIARQTISSETALDDALVEVSALLQTAASVQKEFPDAPALRVQSTLVHLGKTLNGLLEARGEIMRAHGQLLDIAREMGATERPKCPDYAFATVVEDQQAA